MKISQNFNQKMSVAVSFHQKGNFYDAEKLYLNILAEYPNHPDVLNLLGVACGQQGKTDAAINYLKLAITFHDKNPEYYCNLGEIFKRIDNFTDAINCFKKSLALAPKFSMAHFNLANLYKQIGDYENALQHYELAIKHNQNNAGFYYNLGNLYRDLGRFRTAIDTYLSGLKVNPNNANIHNNLAATYIEWEGFNEAETHFKEALKLNPEFEEAHKNLADLFQRRNMTAEAVAEIDKIIKIKEKKWQFEHLSLLELAKKTFFPIIPQSNAEIDQYREKLLEAIGQSDLRNFNSKDLKKYDLTPPSITVYYGRDNKEMKEKYYQLFRDKLPIYPKRPNNEKPNLGFVVTHGHEGVFFKCLGGIVRNLSQEKFKITIICSQPNGEKILRAMLNCPGIDYLEIPAELEKAAEIVYRRHFDLLYYWEVGTDSTNYFLPFYRPANIQCAGYGWPDTTGIGTIDYYFSCELFETEKSAEHYSEKLIRLKNLPTFYYRPPVPEIIRDRNYFGLPEAKNIYLCVQNCRKVHPDFDQLVWQISRKDPQAMILFINDKTENVSWDLEKRMLKSYPDLKGKIKFMPRMEEGEYLSLIKNADVVLDTLYYTGGANSNYDAFACGIPVVTMPSEYYRGRYTLGIYQEIGINDCLANSFEEYSDLAVKIATDKVYREILAQKIVASSAKLFEDPKPVRELEETFLQLLKES